MAWLRPKQTDLVRGKGQFRSRFHHRISYGCLTMIFRDPRNRHRHHLSATLLDGRVGNGLGPVVMMRSRSLGRPGFQMLVMSRIRHAALSLNRSEPAKKGGQNIPKNRCRTTVAEPMVETRAELPFIGDQVGCLSHNQAARLGGREASGSSSSKELGRSSHASALVDVLGPKAVRRSNQRRATAPRAQSAVSP